MIIGLTGGIASGKSTVSKLLEELGAVIIDVDLVGREVVMPGSRALVQIREYYGEEVFLPNGELDRGALGRIVFSDREKLEVLNRITHGEIKTKTKEKVDALVLKGETAIIIDAALLFEIGLDGYADQVWYVWADEKARTERLMLRNGYSEKEASDRINSQELKWESRADAVIRNEGTTEDLKEQIQNLWNRVIGEKN